ncbi:MAG: universal stress protein [Anaerolineae bacterium]|nr:universal stress protein [Anaerolineae bacterium]
MRILMATGGAPHSEAALRFGAHLLQAGRASRVPTIITVIRRDTERLKAEAIQSRACRILDLQPPQVQPVIRTGHPAEEIVREAEEGAYDAVLVGERQQHDLATRFLLGSTAERVVEHAPCPVIIAKGKISPLQRILLCDSGAEPSTLLQRFTTQLFKLVKPEDTITILHVMSQLSAGPGVRGQQLRAGARELIEEQAPEGQLLQRDIQLLRPLNIQPQPKVRHGLVVDEILQEAQEEDYHLVVIGAYQGQGWRRILLDDLTHQIITKVDRPVLIVR